MQYHEFKKIYDSLNRPSDIKILSQELGLDEELVTVIYTQRTVRETTRAFYRVQRYGKDMVRDWEKGKSLLQISEKAEFSPILTALLIFKEMGKSRKQFWSFVRNPEIIPDRRMRKEIEEITAADYVYSPWANEVQCKRGIWGEAKLQGWLAENNITFRTEKDLRGEFQKTPDCLFDKPVTVNGWEVNWIESKATFGDKVEVNKNLKKQLAPYLELFGQGLVVYWFGYLEEVEIPEGIFIMDSALVEHCCDYMQ
jgi:hypothetical protein